MSEIHRQILPIPDVTRPGPITYDAKDPDTSFPPIRPLMPPEQAPNVMLIMLDDVGFGAPSTFGGPCETPVFDRLARNGLRYTRFHTTALCSPDAGTPVALDYESPRRRLHRRHPLGPGRHRAQRRGPPHPARRPDPYRHGTSVRTDVRQNKGEGPWTTRC